MCKRSHSLCRLHTLLRFDALLGTVGPTVGASPSPLHGLILPTTPLLHIPTLQGGKFASSTWEGFFSGRRFFVFSVSNPVATLEQTPCDRDESLEEKAAVLGWQWI